MSLSTLFHSQNIRKGILYFIVLIFPKKIKEQMKVVPILFITSEGRPSRPEHTMLTLTLSCPGMGRAVVKIGHSNFRPGSKELRFRHVICDFGYVTFMM